MTVGTSCMNQIELILLESMQKFTGFLLRTVYNVLPQESMMKVQIFHNLLLEKTLPIDEKSRILLEYSKTLDFIPSENENNLRKNSSSSTNMSISIDKNLMKTSEIENSSSAQLSHETFVIESEKESYFSKPFTTEEATDINNDKTNELFVKISELLSQKTITSGESQDKKRYVKIKQKHSNKSIY